MDKKLIIFDFDGTIADSMGEVIKIVNSFSDRFSFEPVTESEIEELKEMTVRELMARKKISKWKLFLIYWLGRKKFREAIDRIEPFEDCCGIINELKEKSYTLGIITSNSEFSVKKFLNKNNLNIFDFIVSANSLLGKSRIIKKTLQKYNSLPEEAIYIGDEIRDIEAAKRAGVDCIAVGWGYNSKKSLLVAGPTFFAENPREILGILD